MIHVNTHKHGSGWIKWQRLKHFGRKSRVLTTNLAVDFEQKVVKVTVRGVSKNIGSEALRYDAILLVAAVFDHAVYVARLQLFMSYKSSKIRFDEM